MGPDINFLALLIVTTLSQILGFLWYGPLFGKPWSKEMGWQNMTPEIMKEKQKKAMPGYVFNLVFAFVTAYVFAHVLWAFKSDSISSALTGAFWMWLGFVFPIHAGKKFWMDKSWKLVIIDSGYSLASLAVAAIILQLYK